MTHPDSGEQSFPRLWARTHRFTLGVPKAFTVSPDGSRVLFLRTRSGTSRTGLLWAYDVDDGRERLVADPDELLGGAGEQLSAEERARRERSREAGAGIVGYATDEECRIAVFALSGRLWVADVVGGEVRSLPVPGPVIDPRVDPTGRRVAYAHDGALRVVGVDGRDDRALVEPDGPEVVWGQAEFVAAEEMERDRGYWWSPDGESLLVERYDSSPVRVWYIADPANPDREPTAHRYPAAGTDDAEVSLWLVGVDGSRREVGWDRTRFPYLLRVSWTSYGDPVIQVMSRSQRDASVLSVDPASAATSPLRTDHDDDWLDAVPGVPTRSPDGRLVSTLDADDTRRVAVDGEPISPAGLHVRSVLGVDESGVLVSASDQPTQVQLLRVGFDRTVTPLTSGAAVHGGESSGGTTVVSRGCLHDDQVSVTVSRDGTQVGAIENVAMRPPFSPAVRLFSGGEHNLCIAVLLPRDHEPGSARLPVLMDPYGGPHAQRVMETSRIFLEPQWFADQGFAVVVADGRGTPARGHDWERSVRNRLAEVTLADQVEALEAAAQRFPDDLDTTRVGIRGWSYGGYLAALAVLRRPDVFHAAVAGAPVTDQRLYDTFYTERYLGHPDEQPEVYAANSAIDDAARLERPLMIIHGLVDDNVVVAHSLRLSSALLAAGKPHTVLPLSGVTHMASQEEVAQNLQLLQVRFLRDALGVGSPR